MATPPSITVNANGEFSVNRSPELVKVQLRVQLEGADAALVHTKVSAAANELIAELRALASPDHSRRLGEVVIESAFPVTNWSAQSVTTWSYNKRHPDPQHARMPGQEQRWIEEKVCAASATASATFHDFTAMGVFAAKVASSDIANIEDLDWDVTPTTRKSLQTEVRQGAVRDAIAKAQDYAAVVAPGRQPHVVEVNDQGGGGGHVLYKANAVYGSRSGGGGPPTVDFEPAPVAIAASVGCKFTL